MMDSYLLNDSKLKKAALMCPVRNTGAGLEVLMTRRSFWNPNHNRPMTYPGEWTFSGGHYDSKDKDLQETAKREFREETGFNGQFENLWKFKKESVEIFGDLHYLEFYLCNIVPENVFFANKREVMDIKWFKVQDAIDLLKSEDFEKELNSEYKDRDFCNTKYGPFAISERNFPGQTVVALNYLLTLQMLGDI